MRVVAAARPLRSLLDWTRGEVEFAQWVIPRGLRTALPFLFDAMEGLSGMRRNRAARILIWPILAATAIIAVLVSSRPLKREPAPRAASGWSVASTRTAPWPQPLSANEKADAPNRSWAANAATAPSDARVLAAPEPNASAQLLRTEALLERPPAAAATARLHAPVRDEREELAGFDAAAAGSDSGAKISTASSVAGDRALMSLPNFIQPERAESAIWEAPEDSHVYRSLSDSDESASGATPGMAERDRGYRPPAAMPQIEEPPLASDATSAPRGDSPKSGAAWPSTHSLDQMLIEIGEYADAAGWASRVRRTLVALQDLPSLTDPRGGRLLAELQELASVGLRVGEEQVGKRAYQEQLLRTSHALHRRAVIWNAVWRVGAGNDSERVAAAEGEFQTVSARRFRSAPIEGLIEDVRRHATETGDSEDWQRYLLLDQIGHLAATADPDARRLVAQRFLSRLQWDALEAPQIEWLRNESVMRLASRIRPWANAPIDYAALLAQLERQESDAIDLGSIDVATAVQTLRFAGDQRAVDVAEAINTYYRNANVRIAVSDEMLQRLLPEVPTRTTSIHQTIQGAPVRGTGRVASDLRIKLVPDPTAWQLQLGTDGTIHSRTATQRGPVHLSNRTQAAFVAETPIRVDRRGVRVGDTDVAVQSQTQLGGLRTDFDGFPIIDSLVRGIAISQYQQAVVPASRQSEALMRSEIDRTLSSEVEQQIDDSSARLSSRLLGPLARLRLAPLVVDMETTQSRLIVRYRVAGDWQLASFTPRPRAVSDSLLSMQIHQSALNNTFEQLTPSESPQPIRELAANLLDMFGAPNASVPEDMPHDVQIQFARTRPITVEIEEDRLWMTLRIVRLTREGGIDLSHFIVRAAYRAEIDGMQARLVRDGGLQISGPRMGMRERLPVRAIFNTVLSEDRPLPLVDQELAAHPAAKGLEVRTLELTDGWLALAIGEGGSTEY